MSWTHYLLQVNIYLIVFYGFYKLLLDKETYFHLNRIYLVSAGMLSLAIPFLRFEWFTEQPVSQQIYKGIDQLNGLIQITIADDTTEKFNWGSLIVLIYVAGVMFFIVRLLFQLLAVKRLFKSADEGSAFSFFNKKVVDKNLSGLQTIHKHEEIHTRQLHTLDILFFELLGIITWFNPIIYLYKSTVKNIHEYLADEEAADFHGNKEEYALLLLSTAFGIAPNALTNSFFNKSLIKKRIFMLHKQRSKRIAILKYGLFLPLFAIALVLSSATIRTNEKLLAVADEIPLNEPLKAVKEVIAESPAGTNFLENSKKVRTIKENSDPDWSDFYAFASRTILYPDAARLAGIQGNSQIKFSLKDSQVERVGVVTKLGGGCEAEVMKAILAYTGYKASQNGNYTLTVAFKLDGGNSTFKNKKTAVVVGYTELNNITVTAYAASGKNNPATHLDDQNVYGYESIDVQPTFPGGMDKFYAYLRKSVRYPRQAAENNVQGKVFLSYVIEKDGELSDIQVAGRKLGSGTDEEAIRVMKESPRWIPGLQNGKPVRVKYNIPISFTLSNKPDASFQLAPDSSANLLIRSIHANSKSQFKPLIVVNGARSKNQDLNAIDQKSIESVTILKDGQGVALYGADAKNGVILITTKSGKNATKEE